MTAMDPTIARRTWRTLEPLHGMIYFSPEAAAEFDALGLAGRMGYFGSRVGADGCGDAEVVIATFYNFRPDAGAVVDPGGMGARDARTDHRRPAPCRRRRVAPVPRRCDRQRPSSPRPRRSPARAAETACAHVEGRPLFAGHAVAPLARRGPPRAVARADPAPRVPRRRPHRRRSSPPGSRDSRPRSPTSPPATCPARCSSRPGRGRPTSGTRGVEGLRARGILEPGDELVLTEAGRRQRQWIEDATDASAVAAYEPLGDDGCAACAPSPVRGAGPSSTAACCRRRRRLTLARR